MLTLTWIEQRNKKVRIIKNNILLYTRIHLCFFLSMYLFYYSLTELLDCHCFIRNFVLNPLTIFFLITVRRRTITIYACYACYMHIGYQVDHTVSTRTTPRFFNRAASLRRRPLKCVNCISIKFVILHVGKYANCAFQRKARSKTFNAFN